MGAEATKFLVTLTHLSKFNSGCMMRLLHMFEKAPDIHPNFCIVYKEHEVCALMSLINRSSIIRVRNLREGLYSGAMIDSEIHVLIPSMFMAGQVWLHMSSWRKGATKAQSCVARILLVLSASAKMKM